MSKVLIPIGDAAEAMDTLYPLYRVQEDGFEAVVAGPEARIYPLVLHEIPPGWDITRESAGYHLRARRRVGRLKERPVEGERAHARFCGSTDQRINVSTPLEPVGLRGRAAEEALLLIGRQLSDPLLYQVRPADVLHRHEADSPVGAKEQPLRSESRKHSVDVRT